MTTRRSWSLSLGRVLGFPVDVHFTLLLFLGGLLLFGGESFGLGGLILALLLFASVLMHELGHSVVARWLGVPILGISLYPFGGMAKMAGMPRGPRGEIAIAIAGPLVSLALAGIFALLSGLFPGAVGGVLGFLARINGMLGLFNLLPALPMDGGRVLRAWLAIRRGFVPATIQAVRVSKILAWGMIGLSVFASVWLALIGLFVLTVAAREEQMARAGLGHYGGSESDPATAFRRHRVTRDPFERVVINVDPS
jgi:Zn-dependent protease